jgi:hypothetical protein
MEKSHWHVPLSCAGGLGLSHDSTHALIDTPTRRLENEDKYPFTRHATSHHGVFEHSARGRSAHQSRGARTLRVAQAHLMSLMMLNIGRYSEMIMPPTHTPITTINKGSMSDVIASTVASTSWS